MQCNVMIALLLTLFLDNNIKGGFKNGTGAGTGIIVSCLFSPNSSVRTTVIIVGIIMVCIGWYKKSKSDKKVFQYIKEHD